MTARKADCSTSQTRPQPKMSIPRERLLPGVTLEHHVEASGSGELANANETAGVMLRGVSLQRRRRTPTALPALEPLGELIQDRPGLFHAPYQLEFQRSTAKPPRPTSWSGSQRKRLVGQGRRPASYLVEPKQQPLRPNMVSRLAVRSYDGWSFGRGITLLCAQLSSDVKPGASGLKKSVVNFALGSRSRLRSNGSHNFGVTKNGIQNSSASSVDGNR